MKDKINNICCQLNPREYCSTEGCHNPICKDCFNYYLADKKIQRMGGASGWPCPRCQPNLWPKTLLKEYWREL